MNLLEKLWDDTVAGPHPDSGLGRLRRFNPRSTPSKDMAYAGEGILSADDGISNADNQEVKISRKIMIIKPPGYNYQGAGSAPASPADSTPPSSPFSDQEHSGFRGDPQTRMRRQKAMTQPSETLLLLKMSDI